MGRASRTPCRRRLSAASTSAPRPAPSRTSTSAARPGILAGAPRPDPAPRPPLVALRGAIDPWSTPSTPMLFWFDGPILASRPLRPAAEKAAASSLNSCVIVSPNWWRNRQARHPCASLAEPVEGLRRRHPRGSPLGAGRARAVGGRADARSRVVAAIATVSHRARQGSPEGLPSWTADWPVVGVAG